MGLNHQYLIPLAVICLFSTLTGCGQSHPKLAGHPITQSATGDFLPGGESLLLPIGELDDATSPTRVTSDETSEVYGVDSVAQAAENANYVPLAAPQSLAVVPGDGNDLSWSSYGIADLTTDRPVQLDLNVSEAKAEDDGEILPLYYFVGVANFTQYSWDWWGPFTSDTQVSLNHAEDEFEPALTERYVSASGVLQVIVTTGSATGGGDCAVQVDSIVVTTSPSYVWNKPHSVWFTDAHAGSSFPKGAKRLSALKPEQFVTLTWNHVEPFGGIDYFNAPSSYQIGRQAPLDNGLEVIGQTAFPGTSFNDPLDRDIGVPEPVAGTTYKYSIYAENNAGATLPAITKVTVPILPPDGVSASIDGEDGGFTLVSWNEADGAISYEVWRGVPPISGSSEKVGDALESAVSFEDTTASPGTKYWYFIRSVGLGDADESNGMELGSLSGFSQGAQGLRKVELSIAEIEPAVSGTGSEADPYVLTAGNTYQFQVFDQTGLNFTALCLWETIPGLAGAFDVVNTGQLASIQPAPNEFIAQASYSFDAFQWLGTAYCTVE